ncbi:hypothetical protein OBBRIDRAFT_791289 [Obba rivulosa]|uniref:Uncharacterized protein n=1 Tax=Obba rivulosa TaxID=1052685 RepID=A0A8E2AY12_9APHY|nr:hypothetical protein OBBRIDRAFT_791289 [Obba rivulosa]
MATIFCSNSYSRSLSLPVSTRCGAPDRGIKYRPKKVLLMNRVIGSELISGISMRLIFGFSWSDSGCDSEVVTFK